MIRYDTFKLNTIDEDDNLMKISIKYKPFEYLYFVFSSDFTF